MGAAAAVTWAALRLRLLGFSRACRAQLVPLDGPDLAAGMTLNATDLHQLEALWAGYVQTSRLPWSSCLTRAHAAVADLRRRGFPAYLEIGARSGHAFAAHAWVAVNGRRLGAGQDFGALRFRSARVG